MMKNPRPQRDESAAVRSPLGNPEEEPPTLIGCMASSVFMYEAFTLY